MVGNDRPAVTQWHEVFDTQGYTRPQYVALLAKLKSYTPSYLHELEQRLHASLRAAVIARGVKLTQLSDKQSAYIGIAKSGPYKPDHYRY